MMWTWNMMKHVSSATPQKANGTTLILYVVVWCVNVFFPIYYVPRTTMLFHSTPRSLTGLACTGPWGSMELGEVRKYHHSHLLQQGPWKSTSSQLQASWWLNQPISKKISSNWKSLPSRDENKQYLKPPPSKLWTIQPKFDINHAMFTEKKLQVAPP